MKRIKNLTLGILGATILSLGLYACSNDDATKFNTNQQEINTNQEKSISSKIEIDNFVNSETYTRHKTFINSYGELDEENAVVRSLKDQGTTDNVIIIPLKGENGSIVGTLEVVNLKEQGYLPNNDVFAINLVDYSEFNLELKSGNVNMFDVNYDYSKHSKIIIDKNSIVEWETIAIAVTTENIKKSSGIYKLCDNNKDKNISFGECYSCAKESLSGSGTFGEWFCDIPALGWAGCFTTMSAACVVISASY